MTGKKMSREKKRNKMRKQKYCSKLKEEVVKIKS